ncbi:DHH phosphoesterase [Hyphopichia burtonii NRRL Y-1933]|uniref:DHH phosphoesterase n=1 Tax=Hyphopichia burtonii NRRL Y-1933 TaxID=984485 RepID=A0A1E4RHH5_9ASCO|nr:DHH phosphoesterase [Hyphopichia burtonii NRRL Y-1933]ODV66666.1 DHH phosphoesterase [Hyphopichia burtonii NRRL Y-1933]
MPASTSVKAFLAGLKSQLTSQSAKSPIRFVTGNQSADMDSVISAISYSYFQFIFDPSITLVPLINIPRADLSLRRDIVLLLKSHSITEDVLFFLEDLEEMSQNDRVIELVLVDHCNIQGELLSKLSNEKRLKVISIIDHHADEGVFLDSHPRIIQLNGSCSSLVFNYWFDQFNNREIFQNHELVQLLLGPLLVDTSNMTQKVEENDTLSYKRYKGLLNLAEDPNKMNCLNKPDTKRDLDDFYKQLKKAKKDLEGFSFYDILRKDYKQFSFINKSSRVNVGFSSLGKSIFWISKNFKIDVIEKTLESIINDLNLDVIVITTSYTKKENDEYTREFVYYYKDAKFGSISELAKELELNNDIYHQDKLNEMKLINNLKIFNQANIKASRKQVVPVVKNILETQLA